jgi:hypothetical protein
MALNRKRHSPSGAVIAANSALTLSRDLNVNALATAKALANEILTDYNAHVNDYGATAGEHKALHTAGLATAPACGLLATILALTNDLTAKYVLHNVDAKAASPTYHIAQDTAADLAAETTVTTMAGALARLNDIKSKFNTHSAKATAHRVGVATPITSADVAYGVAADVIDYNIKSGDKVFGSMLDDGTGNVTVVSFTAVNGAMRFTASADPQDAIISYIVSRV